MTVNDLWKDFNFRTLLNDLFKARKNDDLAKIRLKAVMDYLGVKQEESGLSVASAQNGHRPTLPTQPPQAQAPTGNPFEQDEGPTTPVLKENLTPEQKGNAAYENFRSRFVGKTTPFAAIFELGFPLSELPAMLESSGLPWQVATDGVTRAGLKPADPWVVRFQPKK